MANTFFRLNGLSTAILVPICLDSSNNVIVLYQSTVSLQTAYHGGNTITTTTGRNIDFTLGSGLATSFNLTNQGTATGFNLNNTSSGNALAVTSGGINALTIDNNGNSTSSGNFTTSGNIATANSGTITSNGLLTASNGLTVTTGNVNITGTAGAISLSSLNASSIALSGTNNLTITANNFNVSGTGINNTAIGAGSTQSTGAFTTLSSNNNTTLASGAGATLTLGNTTGTVTLNGSTVSINSNGAGNALSLGIAGNTASAFNVSQGSNKYINVNTSTGTENVAFGNTSTNPSYSFLGTGQTTFGGNVSVSGTLGVTGNTSLSTVNTSGLATLDSLLTENFATVSGTLTVNDLTQLNSTLGVSGNTSLGGTLGVTGNVSVNTNKFTIDASTGNTVIGGTLTVTGNTSLSTLNTSGLATLNSASVTNNETVGGALTVTGVSTFNGGATVASGQNFLAQGQSTFTPSASSGITVNTTNANTFFRLNGLSSNPGTPICLDSSNNVIACANASLSLQNAYLGGNTITTTTGRNIDFTLGSGLATSFNLTNQGTATGFNLNNTSSGNALAVTSGGINALTIDSSGNLTTNGNFSQGGTATTFSTGTGNVSLNGNTAVTGSNTFTVGTGATSLGGTLGVTGNVSVNTNKFTIDASTGNTVIGGTLTVTGNTSLSTLNTSGLATLNSASVTNNETVGGALTVTGVSTFNGGATVASGQNFLAQGQSTFTPSASSGITVNTTNANTFFRLNGLSSNPGTPICLDSSNNVIACANASLSLQNAYLGGNTITTTTGRNIDFTLGSGLATSFNLTNQGTATGFNLNNTSSGNALAVTSGGINALTIDSSGNLTTNGNFSQGGTATTFSTGTGNVSLNGNTAVTGSNTFTVGTGATSLGGTLGVTGNVSVNTNKFTIDASTGNTVIGGTLTVTGNTSLSTLNTSGLATLNSASVTNNETVGGALTVTGVSTFNGGATVASGQNFLAQGQSTFTPSASSGITVNTTNANTFFRLNGLSSNPGTPICLDSSNNVIACANASLSLQNAYLGGNTITTTTGRNIDFTLGSGLATSFNLTNQGTATGFNLNNTSSGNALAVTSGGINALTIDSSGNLTTNGNFSQGGTATTFSTGTGNVSLNGNTAVTGSNTFTVGTGATSLGGTLGVTGNVSVNTNKFTIDASTGNTVIGGTLTVTGNTSLSTLNTSGLATLNSASVTNNETVGGALTVTGVSTFNGGATVASGQNFLAQGQSTFTPSASSGITVNTTNANTFFRLNGLSTPAAAGVALCLDSSNNVTQCSSNTVTLQTAYAGGNTITTTTGRNIDFTLGSGLATSFNLTNQGTATGFNLNNTSSGNALAVTSGGINALTIDSSGNLTTNGNFSQGGTATTFSTGTGNVSLNGNTAVTGSNTFTVGTGATSLGGTLGVTGNVSVNTNKFTIDASTGNTVIGGTLTVTGNTSLSTLNTSGLATLNSASVTNNETVGGLLTANAGVKVNGTGSTADITTDKSTANIFNTTATTVNLGGAATTISLGATSGTTTINNNLAVSLVDNSAYAFSVYEGANSYLNVSTVDSSENVAFGNTSTNPSYSFLGSGATTFTGNINANSGVIATSQSSASIFNSTATTVNLGGAATNINIGATSGTATIKNAIVSLPNATQVNASNAAGNFNSLTTGGGYTSTGATIGSSGNIQAKGTLTIDLTSTLTGLVTASSGVKINGTSTADITTDKSTATLFNTTATTVNIGGAATTISLGATSGTTTINNNLAVTGTGTFTGALTANNNFSANAQSTFTPSSGNGVLINVGNSNSFLRLTGLTSAAGNPICLDSSNNVIACANAALSLQNAYIGGNTITTSDNRDIAFNLAATGADSNFTVTTAAGGIGYSAFVRADGSASLDPSQLVLIQNLNTGRSLPVGLKIAGVNGGNVTTGIDLTDSYLTTAIDVGGNIIKGTDFSITGSNGNITTSGTVAVNSGSITTTYATGNVFNSVASTLNLGGAATNINIGATSGTATIKNAIVSLPNATQVNASNAAGNFNSLTTGGGYTSTGATIDNSGNIQANGNLTIIGTSDLNGNTTVGAALGVTGNVSVNTNKFTIDASTGNTVIGGTLTVTGNTSLSTLNTSGLATLNSASVTNNETVGGALTVTGVSTFNGGATVASGQNFLAQGQSTFTPSASSGITVNTTNANTFFRLNGLSSNPGTPICLDSSNNVIACANASLSLQNAYLGGNTITTTTGRNIDFTLASSGGIGYDANFNITTANGSTSSTIFSLADGSNTTVPNQLVLLDNKNTTNILPSAIKVTSSGGGAITNAIDLSDSHIVNALSLGTGNITSAHFTLTGTSGNISTDGLLTVGAGVKVNGTGSTADITTDKSTATLFNTTATTVNIGGAATAVNIGATSGTTTINSGTLSLPNATAVTAGSALLTIDSASIGGGYGSTGVTISNTGNIQADGTLTIGSTSDLKGQVTAEAGVKVNGTGSTADITTDKSTANIFNTTATTVNLGGAATTISLGATSGTTTINSGTLSLPNATAVTAGSALLTIDSASIGGGYGSTGVTISNTGNIQADGTLTIGSTSDLKGQVTAEAGVKVNGTGSTADITTDKSTANIFNTTATTVNLGGAATTISLGATSGTTTINNNLAVSLVDNSAYAFSVYEGANSYLNVSTVDSSENVAFGNTSTNPSYSFLGSGATTFTGNINANSGVIATSQSSASIFNSTATTVNLGGAATNINIGATSGTATIKNAIVSLPNATQVNASNAAGNFNSLTTGGGYTSTGATIGSSGNIQANGTLTINGTSLLSGAVTTNDTLTVNGTTNANIVSSNSTVNLFNSGSSSLYIGGGASTISLGATTGTTTVNTDLTLGSGKKLTTTGPVSFNPGSSNNVAITTGASSFLVISGLSQTSGSAICVDSSNRVVKCDSSTQGLQAAYNNGNTITTASSKDIAFNLANNSNFSVTTAADTTGYSIFREGPNSITTVPNQLILVDNAGTIPVPEGIVIGNSGGGGIITGVDVSAATTTGIALGGTGISGTNFNVNGSTGDVTTSGTINANGGTIATTSTGTVNLFNTNATGLNIGGAATGVSIGATSGTATIKNAIISLPNATQVNASNASGNFNSLTTGSGYTSGTGTTITSTGVIQTKSNLTVDGSSTLTGDVTTSGTINANGGTLATSVTGTASIFNTNATGLNIGGAATTISLGATSGTTTINNNLTLGSGKTLTTTGPVSFNPGSGNNVAITTGASSFLTISGLSQNAGSSLCLDGSNHVGTCNSAAQSLQAAYNNGNTITTTDARDIAFTLAPHVSTTDSNFTVTTANGSTGGTQFLRASGGSTNNPSQLVLIQNQATGALPIGLKVGGVVTTAVDLSDSNIVNALNLGGGNVLASKFSITGSTGNISTSGTLTVDGGSIATTISSSTINLFNTNATTVNLGGAATTLAMGATSGTASINNTTINFNNATAINAASAVTGVSSLTTGGGYGSTGATIDNSGNIQAKGTLTIDSTSQLSGAVTTNGTLTVNGASSANIVSSNSTVNLFNSGSSSLYIGGGASTISLGATTGTTTVNTDLTLGSGKKLTTTGPVSFNPGSSNNVAITGGANSYITVSGMQTTTGQSPTLCIDSSNRIVKCDASANLSLQSAYNNGNSITTTSSKDIVFNLANNSNFSVTTAAGATGNSMFSEAANAGSTVPTQLILVDNAGVLGVDNAIPTAIKVTSTGGAGFTTGIDVSAALTTGIALGTSGISGTYFNVDTAGNTSMNGTLTVNGGTIGTTVSLSTINLFNTNATTVNLGGAATNLAMGATSGTATINNAIVNFPHATTIGASGAAGNFKSLTTGGGYGSTGATIDNSGNIQAKGTLTIDSTSQLSGAVTTNGTLTVNGASSANIVSSNSTVNLFNSGSSSLYIGGGASTISLGATTGTTTVNTDLTLGSGKKLTTTGPVSFNPGSSNNVAITTSGNSFLSVSGLQASTGTPICVDGSNHVVTCTASATLQSAYNNGNSITTTSSKDIVFNLANNSNFSVTTAAGATGNSMFSEAANAGSTVPTQLILVDNAGVLGVDNAIPTAIKVTSTGGAGFTTGIDVSAALTTGIALGTSGISGTYFNVDTAGNTSMNGTLTVNGGTIGTTVSLSTINLFNTNATTVNLGGAATNLAMGATSGTATINNAIVNFPHATTIGASGAAGNFKSLTTGGGYGSTGATIDNSGNIQAKGTLTIDSTSQLSGAVTTNGTLTVNGTPNANIVSSNSTVNLFNSGSSSLYIGGGASTISLGATTGTTTVNNNLTITGTLTGNGQTNLTPANNNNVAITLAGTSNFSITGLSGAAGTSLCLDSSNRVATCNAGSSAATLQSAYNTGNTITTSSSKDITFSLAGSSSNFSVITPASSTAYSAFTRASGTGSVDPSQLVLIQNQQTRTLPIGLKVAGVSSGVVTTAIDLSDANITNALALGAGNITATHFSLTGSNGNLSTDGTLAVNGGTISTNQSTFNLVNDVTATTVNFAEGATNLTMGATSGTASIRNGVLSLPNATAVNASSATGNFYSLTTGGGYSSTGATIDNSGNIQAKGTLTIDSTSQLTGTVTAGGGLVVNGTGLTGDITTAKATGTLFNTSTATVNIGGAATTISIGATTGTTTINNALTISGTLTANGAANIGNGSSTIALSGTTLTTTTTSTNTISIPDNLASAFDIKQGSNDYFNITTTNGSRSISFGNATTNPAYNFNGSGTMTLTGSLVVNGGNVSATSGTSVNLFNTSQTTSLSIGGNATTIALGAATGTTTVSNNLTVSGATTTLASTLVSLTGTSPVVDTTGSNTLSINATHNNPVTFGSGTFTVNSSTINLAGTSPVAIAATTTNAALAIDSNGSGALNLQGTNTTGDVNIAGGYNNTGCTIYNASGNISCSGSFTTNASTGTVQFGYFNRNFTTGVISNATAGDTLSISSTSNGTSALTIANTALTGNGIAGFTNNLTITGTGAGNKYYGENTTVTNNQTGAADTAYGENISFVDAGALANTVYGLYVDASTANANDTQYAAAFMNGNVGIGTNTPTAKLGITGATGDTGLTLAGITSGTEINLSSSITSGTGMTINAAGLTSGNGIILNGTSPTNPAAFSGNMISIAPTRTISSGTSSINDTGNYLSIARSNSVSVANTFTISGDLVKLSSGCTVSNGGVCADTSHLLSLYQTLASASGSLLYINNVSKGLALDINSMGYTNPVASISGTTSFAALVANNNGVGDLFTASASGWTRFSIDNSGNVNTTGNLTLAGTTGLTLSGNGADINFTGAASNIDTLTTANNNNFAILPNGTGFVGLNTTSPVASFDVRGNSGTLAAASVSAKTSFAALVANNNGVGDLFTASASGWTRFVIKNNGNVGIGTSTPSTTVGGNVLEINSTVAGNSGLKFTQLNSNSAVSSNYSQLLGLDSSGDVGLSSAGISLTSPALAYWDATHDPTGANYSYPQASVLSLGSTNFTPTWTLANGEQLTNANTNETGDINWSFSQVPFEEIQFQFKAGGGNGADSTWFYSYADDIPTTEYGNASGSTHNFTQGYLIYFTEWHNCVGISYGPYLDQHQCNPGAQGTGPIAAAPLYNIADGNWHAVDIQILYNQIVVRWDGNVVLTATDQFGRDTSKLNFGFASRTGGDDNNHYIKGLLVTKLGTNTSQYYISSNVSPLASGLYWNNASTSASTTTGLGKLGINVTSPAYTLEMNGTMNIHAPVYNTGTAEQGGSLTNCSYASGGSNPTASTTVTGIGTSWTSALVGDIITMPDGTEETITAVGSTTSMTVSGTRGICPGTYSINAPQTLMVSSANSTLPAVNVGGVNAYAALAVNNSGTGDVFTASSSGTTLFTIGHNGNLTSNASSGTGLNFANNGITTDINLQNGGTIDNHTNGQIKLATAGTTGNLTDVDFIGTPTLTGALNGLQVDVSGLTTTQAGANNLTGLNIVGFQGGSTNNYGMNIGTITGTGSSVNYGLNIGNVTGGGTNYGLRVQTIAAAAANYALYIDAPAQNYFAGNLGLGTTSPNAAFDIEGNTQTLALIGTGATSSANIRFQVTNSISSTASAQIWNAFPNSGNSACTNSQCHTALSLKLGANNTSLPGLGDRFINFATGNGTIIGKIQGNGANVAYASAGGDYAEWFRKDNPDQNFAYGDVVCLNANGNVVECDSNNNQPLGVISSSSAFIGNSNYDDDPAYVLVGLFGQISTSVSNQNGNIETGDFLTVSPTTGVAMKASSAGQVIGEAMEDYSSDQVGQILVRVNPTWYDPQVYLTDTGNLNLVDQNVSDINYTIPHYYTLNDALGNPLQRVGEFSSALIANLQAGSANIQQLTTNALKVTGENITINGQNIHDYIASIVNEVLGNQTGVPTPENMHTDLISPLASDSALAIKFDNNELEILNSNTASGSAVAIIDNQGNASFSGKLNSNELAVSTNATVSGTLTAGKIVANSLELSNQALTDLASELSTASGFAVSGGFQINGELTSTNATLGSQGQLAIDNNGNLTTSGALNLTNGSFSSDNNGNLVMQLANNTSATTSTQFTFKNAAGANVFSVDSTGNAALSGTLTTSAGNYDLAEDYPTKDDVEAGDVLSVSLTDNGFVTKSNGTYDTNVIGIYSTKPGFRLSETDATINGGKTVPIALAGRVPVKVSTENGAIHKGDYLTTSSTSGVAMKASKPGQVIGKALADFNQTGVGKIMVFVDITFADPEKALANIITDDNGNIAISSISSNSVILPNDLQIGTQEVGGTLNNALLAISNTLTSHENKLNTLQTDVLGLATQSASLNSRIASLETIEATASSQIAQSTNQVASNAADVASLSRKVDDIISSLSAMPTAPVNVSSAADLGLGNDVELSTATVSGNLNVLGQTTVNDLGITGNVSMGVLKLNGLNDNGTASINTLSGDLSLQDYGLGGLNILSGKVTIDKDGNVNIQKTVTAQTVNTQKLNITTATATSSATLSASAGTATISQNTDSVTIKTTAVTNNSLIYVTFSGDYSPAVRYWIEGKVAGNSFTVKLDAAVANSVKFNWWIVN